MSLRLFRRTGRRWLLLTAIASLAGCAAVDRYAGRAVVYNIEAENAQEQALLLNIVRAYRRRPMQFTTVSTITGTASSSATAGFTNPIQVPFRPTTNSSSIAGFPPVPTWTVSGSMSGGPTFTVPVLDTQEFYDGILKPIPAQLWDLYIQNTYPRDLMINLLVQKIVLRKLDPECTSSNHARDCELVIHNYVGEDVEIELFQIFTDYLLSLGLTTQPDRKKDSRLNPAFNVNLNMQGSSLGGSSAPATGGGTSGGADTAAKYSLCFAPRNREDQACIVNDSLCNTVDKIRPTAKQSHAQDKTRACGGPDQRQTMMPTANKRLLDIKKGEGEFGTLAAVVMSGETIDRMQSSLHQIIEKLNGTIAELKEKIATGPTEDLVRELENNQHTLRELVKFREDVGQFRERPVLVSIYMRSVEGIIYYLGEVTRRSLAPDFGVDPRTIYYTYTPRFADYPEGRCFQQSLDPEKIPKIYGRPSCLPIFIVREGVTQQPGTFLATYYDGAVYSVDNYSGAVLEIVKQALALQSSAKSLPQSNVLSIAGGQ